MEYISESPETTRRIASELAERAAPGSVYCLSGDLGAGKTAFAQGFAHGLGVKDSVTSPTFCIVNEYAGRLPLYHFDVYRLAGADDAEDIGFTDYLYGGGVCVIEWAEFVADLIPDGAVWVYIGKDGSKPDDFRKITISYGRL